MTASVQITISPNATGLIQRYGNTPALGQVLANTLDSINEDTLNLIRIRLNVAGNSKRGKAESQSRDYPYPHKVTSRLQNSMGRTKSVFSGSGKGFGVASTIGSGVSGGKEAVRYAAIQEYGGVVDVPSRPSRAKIRTIKGVSLYARFGESYRSVIHPPTKAYQVKIPERSFLRSSVNDRAQAYSRRISRAVKNFFGGLN